MKAKTPAAYSYVRFSTGEQRKGDSARRQLELSRAWAESQGVRFDDMLTLKDEGVSAFAGANRENADRHALAAFLDLVKAGRVPRGSYLIVEALDRLSREHIRPALALLLNLIESGIRVVQLQPTVAIYDDQVEPMMLMLAIAELSRGHSESKMKSERCRAAWAEKKRQAAAGVPHGRNIAPWLRLEDGKYVVKPQTAAVVLRVFTMARTGLGALHIAKQLNEDQVPPFSRRRTTPKAWYAAVVGDLLRNRRVLGEYQPRKKLKGQYFFEGPAIPDYYPRVVPAALWDDVQAGVDGRAPARGEKGIEINLFNRLLRDARDGSNLHVKRQFQAAALERAEAIVNADWTAVAGPHVTFPLEVFERVVLRELVELNDVDPRSVKADDAQTTAVIASRLSDVEARIARLKGKMVAGDYDVAALVDVLRQLEADRIEARAELLAAQDMERRGYVFTSFKTLVADVERPRADEARRRLRSVLRRVVDEIWCLFTYIGAARNATQKVMAAQVWFPNGDHRDYLMEYNRRTFVTTSTCVKFTSAAGATLDLRDRDQARELLEQFERRSRKEIVSPFKGKLTLRQALKKAQGNRVLAARLLGWSTATIYRRMAKLGLDLPRSPYGLGSAGWETVAPGGPVARAGGST